MYYIAHMLVVTAGRFETFAEISWGRILVQVTLYRRLRIGLDDHLDQSEAYDIMDISSPRS